ncbi:MAG: hypothetical protein Q8R17_01235 [bacterium]|nr:hypothetical protein [bacterium]
MAKWQDPDLEKGRGAPTHSGFGLICKVDENGLVSVLCMDSLENNPRTGQDEMKLQFPGGTGIAGETPLTTTTRETSAEVTVDQRALPLRRTELIHKVIKPGDVSKGGGIHTQYFFLLELEIPVSYRTFQKTETDGTLLFQPKFLEIGEFTESRLAKKTHKEAAANLLHHLAETHHLSPQIKGSYGEVLERFPKIRFF